MWKEILYTFGVIYFTEVQAQFCTCGGSIQQFTPIQETLSPPIFRPEITSIPVDSSVSNSLANVLQLLIVSDVIASTINPRASIPPCIPTVTTICDQIYPPPDFMTPRTEFISPSSPIIELLRPKSPLESIVNMAPVTNLGGNVCSLQEIISVLPNFESTSPCLRDINPTPRTLGSNLSGGLTELVGPIKSSEPVAELKCTPRIQETLTCNIGSPFHTPCNLNVGALPCASVNYIY